MPLETRKNPFGNHPVKCGPLYTIYDDVERKSQTISKELHNKILDYMYKGRKEHLELISRVKANLVLGLKESLKLRNIFQSFCFNIVAVSNIGDFQDLKGEYRFNQVIDLISAHIFSSYIFMAIYPKEVYLNNAITKALNVLMRNIKTICKSDKRVSDILEWDTVEDYRQELRESIKLI